MERTGFRMSEEQRLQEAIERGLARAKQEDWMGAIESFRRAVMIDSHSVEARFRLGWALWKRAESLKPSLADLGLGYLAMVAGFDTFAKDRSRKFVVHKRLLQEACHWLREAIARDPKHARAHFY